MAGCNLLTGVPAGTLIGEIRFDGRPAPGLSVRLQILDKDLWGDAKAANGTAPVKAVSDANGQYRFDKLASGQYRVRFERTPLLVGGLPVGPMQVGTWNSLAVTSGSQVPAFDVAYNGLIYPESGKSSLYSNSAPLPFHWSTHRDGVSYRVHLYDISANGHRSVWPTATWGQAAYTTLSMSLPKGNYSWEVEIDGGGTGTGTSPERNVDLDFQEPVAPSSNN